MLRSVNIFSANIFAMLCSIHLIIFLLNCITGTLQATEGNAFLKGRILVSTLLTLNIPSLARQRCLSSWDPRRNPCFLFFVISQLFDAVDYSNYVFWVSDTIIQ